MTACIKIGLVCLLGVATMIFGAFLGLELARMVAGLFLTVRWNIPPHALALLLGDGIVMVFAFFALAHAPQTTATPYPSK